jgi:hypothetical protein
MRTCGQRNEPPVDIKAAGSGPKAATMPSADLPSDADDESAGEEPVYVVLDMMLYMFVGLFVCVCVCVSMRVFTCTPCHGISIMLSVRVDAVHVK